MNTDPCPYCGGTCPSKADDSPYLCHGYVGDVKGLVEKMKREKSDQQDQLDKILSTDFSLDIKMDLVAVTGTKQRHGRFYFRLINDLSKFDLGDKITLMKRDASTSDLKIAKQISKLYEG